jgi:hypothetical protein
MIYFRIVFKKDDSGQCVFTDVIEQNVENEEFEKMNWEKPIIRHEVADHIHFLALDRGYLEAMMLGISTYQNILQS